MIYENNILNSWKLISHSSRDSSKEGRSNKALIILIWITRSLLISGFREIDIHALFPSNYKVSSCTWLIPFSLFLLFNAKLCYHSLFESHNIFIYQKFSTKDIVLRSIFSEIGPSINPEWIVICSDIS